MNLRFTLFALCWMMTTVVLSAQTISGVIKDASSGESLIGANVLVKGTTMGTATDFDGNFELKVDALPVDIVVSYTGYAELEYTISSTDPITIELAEDAVVAPEIEVVGQRVSDKQKAAPLTVESMDLLAIKETAADNFYDGLGAMKGVDLTAASLGFKIINTRGFNSTSPVRSLQLIDGVDNQAPGLNFSLGNFLGTSDLDVLKVDIIQGASSAFYGPNAFNGVIAMQTKNPFLQKGLSASVKVGERNMVKSAIRWADEFKNEDGLPWLAYKINAAYLTADDWEADNYDPVDGSRVPNGNPGRWDAVNIYGDEFFRGNDFSGSSPWENAGLGTFYRTGYQEDQLVNYETDNFKSNVAIHIRTAPEQEYESPEFIVSGNYSRGSTVYQGDNRFYLNNIQFYQTRLEYKKTDKFSLELI